MRSGSFLATDAYKPVLMRNRRAGRRGNREGFLRQPPPEGLLLEIEEMDPIRISPAAVRVLFPPARKHDALVAQSKVRSFHRQCEWIDL